MTKISTDGSGVGVIIHGCPYCDDVAARNLRYYDSHWTIDPDMDAGRRSFWIHYCPCCGKILPLLGGWEVKHPTHKHCLVVDDPNVIFEVQEDNDTNDIDADELNKEPQDVTP